MRQDHPVNPSTAEATVLVDELIRGGVREAVLSPGSRSAPLAYALHAADRAGRLRLHVRVDERSAGFLAVGLAKASGAPVAVACTSGTAAANLHPAVLEASESGLPLVVLTADRPPELRGAGANQTVDQLGLYGRAARLFAEVGTATERAGEVAYWRALVCRALAAATGVLSRDPGPVHLNCAFREPLVPDADPTWPEPLDGRPGGAPWTRVEPAAAERAPIDDGPHRTLVVVGDAPLGWGDAAVRLAESRGWPVLSEPSGNARRGPSALTRGHVLLDRLDALGLVPERVLVVGRPTLWRPVQALLRRADLAVEVCAPTARWADAVRSAVRVLPAVPEPGHAHPVDPAWLDAWRAADAEAAEEADALGLGRAARRAHPRGRPARRARCSTPDRRCRPATWPGPRRATASPCWPTAAPPASTARCRRRSARRWPGRRPGEARPGRCSATSPSCTTPAGCCSAPTSRAPTCAWSSPTTTAAASSG